MHVLVYFRDLIDDLEGDGLLDKHNELEVYAFSMVVQPLVQVGLDSLRAAWNAHSVSGRTGCPGSGGVPTVRAADAPHPGGQTQLPRAFDGAAEYEVAAGRPLRRVPAFVRDVDPLLGRQNLCAWRAAGVEERLGDLEEAYSEIVEGDYDRFTDAYEFFLRCSLS